MPDLLSMMHAHLQVLRAKVNEEKMQRWEITHSPEYVKLQLTIDNAKLLQTSMTEDIGDSSKEYAEYAKQFAVTMKDEGKAEFRNVRRIDRNAATVNKERLVQVLQGDLTTFLAIANVTQKSLKDHAAGNAHEKELLSCIEPGTVPSDVEFMDEQTAESMVANNRA